MVPIVQLVRTSDCGSEGQGFESPWAPDAAVLPRAAAIFLYMSAYAQVIVPKPLEGTFTYIVPDGMTVGPGFRVIVPFGPRHFYTGVVESVSTVAPEGAFNLKEISSVLDTTPSVRPSQIRFWHWMADYYLCAVGDVFKAALPAGLKIESETRLSLNDQTDPEVLAQTGEAEQKVMTFLDREGSAPASAVTAKTGVPGPQLTRMVDKGLLLISEKLVERYRAVRREYVRPLIPRDDRPAFLAAFAAVKRSQRQEEALVALIALSEFNRAGSPPVEVPLEVLMERTGCTRAIVKALADKGLAEIYSREISRFSFTGASTGVLPTLSAAQSQALQDIYGAFRDRDICLLHGVTGSGKTEIYMHLADYVMQQGRQVLFLVPEIALTTQLTRRLQTVFGSKVVIYHSKFSDNERVDRWKQMLRSGQPCIVLGARSAVFLPFERLGLVIVDEEHEPSYKQYDPAPRYNGRDAAAVLAAMHGAKTVFGSATPTIETYYKAQTGKFGLVSLTERFGQAALPAIEIVDMKAERGRRAVTGYFSHRLLDCTLDAVGRHRQAILFHNRRGYAPVARCSMCAFTPKCDFCDVSLTYHKSANRLVCHYCGNEYAVPRVCPECREPAIEISGYGTERLEDELAANFRDRRILRMDLDTTRNKDGYSRIIDDFSAHKADILVGTQMVTKGLDFGEVELVGVLNADTLINLPDFRAAERAFNMIEQVAGRAGRRDGQGRVVIQTYSPDNVILRYACTHDYAGFYAHELEERRSFGFPPFTRIINIYVRHRDSRTATACATALSDSLRQVFGSRVSPPQEPPVGRVQNMYIRKIMLKMETGTSMAHVRGILRQKYIDLSASPLMSGLQVYYDVDPV